MASKPTGALAGQAKSRQMQRLRFLVTWRRMGAITFITMFGPLASRAQWETENMEVTRRNFLGASAAAVIAAGTVTKGKVYGANEKIGVCVMGVGGRGGSHIDAFSSLEGSDLVALCDVDQKTLEAKANAVQDKTGKRPKLYTDVREALADPDVDALTIATPNHWHTLATIWACEAGKDVYVEKPATHSIWEGRQLQAAAKKYNRIVQHGTQRRSEAVWIRDIQLLQSGDIIGPVYMARGLCYKNGNRGDIGFSEDQEPPAHLNWDLWQGPAARKAYNPEYHPYQWHWFWHYGNGEIGNQGVHQMDVGAWAMNKGLPVKVYSAGGRYTYKDQAETPNTNITTYTYDDGTVFVFEVRNRFTNTEGGNLFSNGVGVGNLFYADGGYYVEGQGFYDTKNQLIPVDDAKYPMPEDISCWQNFLTAVRSRKWEDIRGNVEDAHVSSAHCHMGAISYRLGRSLEFDPKTERFSDEQANTMLKREYAPGFEVPELA